MDAASSWSQQHAQVRMEWGPVGARMTSSDANYAVVVDVLSFTTTLSVAMDAGIEVYPYRWNDESAADHARLHVATLAVGRFEARDADGAAKISLSPATIRNATGLARLVLPSPNGSAISCELAEAGAKVVGACLRNRTAAARWVASRMADSPGSCVTVVAAGERWPDGSLRPAVEDLWGAGAVIAALRGCGVGDLSPEARMAAAAFEEAQPALGQALSHCSSGRELSEAGFAADVEVASELDSTECVPRLVGQRFVDAA